jgi:uncharacterized YccA/Bax inhibitor family protein
MRTSNPALNDKTFAPERVAVLRTDSLGGPLDTAPDTMRVGGVVEKAAFLITLTMIAGAFGWSRVDTTGAVALPGWLLVAMLAGLGVAILTVFKPKLSPFTSPVYAVLMGTVAGAISAVYNAEFDGIVLQAIGATAGVFVTMLVTYRLGIIKVTDKFRSIVVAATGGVMLVYLLSIALNFFGVRVPFIHETGPLGIAFSLFVVGLAAMNLLLDFDLIERGAASGAPAYMEWYGAFGLLVTLVWLYLEMLRLLAKLRR